MGNIIDIFYYPFAVTSCLPSWAIGNSLPCCTINNSLPCYKSTNSLFTVSINNSFPTTAWCSIRQHLQQLSASICTTIWRGLPTTTATISTSATATSTACLPMDIWNEAVFEQNVRLRRLVVGKHVWLLIIYHCLLHYFRFIGLFGFSESEIGVGYKNGLQGDGGPASMWGRALFSSFISLGGDLRSVRLSLKSLFWQLITYIFPLNERKEQNHHIEEQFFFLSIQNFTYFIFLLFAVMSRSL